MANDLEVRDGETAIYMCISVFCKSRFGVWKNCFSNVLVSRTNSMDSVSTCFFTRKNVYWLQGY